MLEPEKNMLEHKLLMQQMWKSTHAYLLSTGFGGCSVVAGLSRQRGRDRSPDCIARGTQGQVGGVKSNEKIMSSQKIRMHIVSGSGSSAFYSQTVGMACCPHSAWKSSTGDWISSALIPYILEPRNICWNLKSRRRQVWQCTWYYQEVILVVE